MNLKTESRSRERETILYIVGSVIRVTGRGRVRTPTDPLRMCSYASFPLHRFEPNVCPVRPYTHFRFLGTVDVMFEWAPLSFLSTLPFRRVLHPEVRHGKYTLFVVEFRSDVLLSTRRHSPDESNSSRIFLFLTFQSCSFILHTCTCTRIPLPCASHLFETQCTVVGGTFSVICWFVFSLGWSTVVGRVTIVLSGYLFHRCHCLCLGCRTWTWIISTRSTITVFYWVDGYCLW